MVIFQREELLEMPVIQYSLIISLLSRRRHLSTLTQNKDFKDGRKYLSLGTFSRELYFRILWRYKKGEIYKSRHGRVHAVSAKRRLRGLIK